MPSNIQNPQAFCSEMKPAPKLHITVNTDFYLIKPAVGCASQSQQPHPRERLWLYGAISDKLVQNSSFSLRLRLYFWDHASCCSMTYTVLRCRRKTEKCI